MIMTMKMTMTQNCLSQYPIVINGDTNIYKPAVEMFLETWLYSTYPVECIFRSLKISRSTKTVNAVSNVVHIFSNSIIQFIFSI